MLIAKDCDAIHGVWVVGPSNGDAFNEFESTVSIIPDPWSSQPLYLTPFSQISSLMMVYSASAHRFTAAGQLCTQQSYFSSFRGLKSLCEVWLLAQGLYFIHAGAFGCVCSVRLCGCCKGIHGITPLHLSALLEDDGRMTVNLLSFCGPQIFTHAESDDGVTPFHLALQMGHFRVDKLISCLQFIR